MRTESSQLILSRFHLHLLSKLFDCFSSNIPSILLTKAIDYQYVIQIYLVMPLKIELPLLSEDLVRTRTGKERTFRKQDCVYVPLLPKLQKLLSMRDVYREVKTEYKPSPSHYSRYEDGENYNLNPLFQLYPRLRILLFESI